MENKKYIFAVMLLLSFVLLAPVAFAATGYNPDTSNTNINTNTYNPDTSNTNINTNTYNPDTSSVNYNAGTLPTLDSASTSGSNTTSVTFPNPLGNVTTVSALLYSILTHLMGIMAIIAVIFMVIGGIMYMISGGNEAMVTRAKKTWTGAAIGLAIAMAAPTFLKEIQAILGGNTSGDASSWVSNSLTLQQIAINVLNLLLSVLGIIAMISMVIGGMMFLTAAGDERRIDKGKSIFTYSLLGVIAALSAVIVIKEINYLLGG